MGFLQPWMLWVLPAILLPIVIHLLNRLRYRTVHWAAMIFLLKANRAATRRAKLKQWLLLACRVLVLGFLIWAMSRPLVGGWLGAAAGGAPEAVVILLDRSASMEGRAGDGERSKRTQALALLAEAAKLSGGSRFVLIENVGREPLEVAGGAALAALQLAEPTDTGADLPAMFRAASEWLVRNKPGSAEVWVASDLQASNWRPESPEWADLAARFAGFTQGVRVRVIDLAGAAARNISVAVRGTELRVREGGKAQLAVSLEMKATEGHAGTVPVFITRDGARSQLDLPIAAGTQRQTLRFDLAAAEGGWGKVELPADGLLADNTGYFTFGLPVPVHAVAVGSGPAAQRIRFAAAPGKGNSTRTAEVRDVAQAALIDWKRVALLVWAAPAPEGALAAAIISWVESGGVLLCLPPGGEGGVAPLGVVWNAVEDAAAGASFRVTTWDELDGPLARTEGGASLPLARAEVLRRQVPVLGDTAHVYATFADGQPFLVGRNAGGGQVFACATLPEAEWSTLGEGFVLLPMVQRLFTAGGLRLAPPALATAGVWTPPDDGETWTAVETDRRRDWRWQAGVYSSGARRVALNRPEIEDLPDTLDRARLPDLLRGVPLTVLAGALDMKADRLQSEIWPAMLAVVMLFMCAEMGLATSRGVAPGAGKQAGMTVTRRTGGDRVGPPGSPSPAMAAIS